MLGILYDVHGNLTALDAVLAEAEREGVAASSRPGSPLPDVDSSPPQPDDGDERLLAGVGERQVVFGHSHLQFRRPGPGDTDLVNPGSVGMPLDGDTRAAWAIRRDGEIEFRRTAYDPTAAVEQMREFDWGERIAQRLLNGRD